jgi:peroxiredoxin family protein
MAIRSGEKAGKKAARRVAARIARRTGKAKPPGLAELVREEVARALAEERRSRTSRGANRATIIVFSGDLDRVMSALILATGAAAVGMEVSLFFTFWGLGALRRGTLVAGDGALSRAFTALTPSGLSRLGLSRLNFGGLGARMLRTMMKQKGVATAEELLALARESNVRMVACTTSMDLMGLSPKDLVPGIEVGGVATYLGDASDSRITLFI